MIGALHFTGEVDQVDAAIALTVARYYLTVEAWVYVSSSVSPAWPIVRIKQPTGETVAVLSLEEGTLTFSVTDYNDRTLSVTGALTVNTPHHVMGTWDYNYPRARLWVDQVMLGETVTPPRMVALDSDPAAFPVQFGGTFSDPAIGFRGWIGPVRISKTVRANDYSTAGTAPAVDTHTLGQWNMAEGTGTVLDDAVGVAAHDGTITGALWSYLPEPVHHLTLASRNNDLTLASRNNDLTLQGARRALTVRADDTRD